MAPKFRIGYNVVIVGYGQAIHVNKATWRALYGDTRPKNILADYQTVWVIDIMPELVGLVGTVNLVQPSRFGMLYGLTGIPKKAKYFHEDQLEPTIVSPDLLNTN